MKMINLNGLVLVVALAATLSCSPFKSQKHSAQSSKPTRTISAVTGPIQSVVVQVTSFEMDYINIDTDLLETVVVQQNVGLVDLARLEMDGFAFSLNDPALPPTMRIRAIRFLIGNTKPIVRSEQGACEWPEGNNLTQINFVIPNNQSFDLDSGKSYLMRATFEAINPVITGGNVVMQELFKTEPDRDVATSNCSSDLKHYKDKYNKCKEEVTHYKNKYNNCGNDLKKCQDKVKLLESQIVELKKELQKCKDSRSCPADQCQECIKKCESEHDKGYGKNHKHGAHDKCHEKVDCEKKCQKHCPGGNDPGEPTGLVCSFTPQLTLVGFEALAGGMCPAQNP